MRKSLEIDKIRNNTGLSGWKFEPIRSKEAESSWVVCALEVGYRERGKGLPEMSPN